MDNNQIAYYQRNMAYAKPQKTYQTQLSPAEEIQFLKWIRENQVPYDPSPQSDYDMAGFWRALRTGDARATQAINPNDNRIHYPDTWKTPYHQTFSRQSQWALPSAPDWNDLDQLVMPDGTVIFDERKIK